MFVIVPRSGIAGDMLLSALIDLGADEKTIAAFIKKELGVVLRAKSVMSGGIGAKRLVLSGLSKEYSPGEMKKKIEASSLGKDAKALALQALETIITAEKRIHKTDHVHFHELSNVDTLVDMMGCALALSLLGEKEVYILPLEVGKIQPAALDILTRSKLPFYSSTDSIELTTPTGAALASAIAKPINGIPEMISEKIGHGAGTFERKGEPNVLFVICGGEADKKEKIVVLETNIDDVSGEVLAYAVERLLEGGARDAHLIPIIAKKGRPGVILRAICERKNAGRLAQIIFDETGTLGIRESECIRHIASRSVLKSKTKEGEQVNIKVGRISGRVISAKPEFEDLKKIAKKTGKSVREISKNLR
ncbi:MAG: nickel pincer cofactor biosynthesis protein LarC [Candidatus Micrarchaeota archaeon]